VHLGWGKSRLAEQLGYVEEMISKSNNG